MPNPWKPQQPAEPIGKKRHRIEVYSAANDGTRDTFGRRLHRGALLAVVWAERQDWNGDEVKEGGRETASVTTRFIVRHRDDLSAAVSVEEGSDVYNVLSVLDLDGTQRELVLNCRKVVP